MASAEDAQETFMSQQAPTIVTQVQAEPIDIALIGGPSLADFIAEHGNPDESQEFGPNSQEETQDGVGVAEEIETQGTTGPTPAKKRKRLTFANKKLLGGRELFLLPQFVNQFGDDTVQLCGKITKCATKKDPRTRFVVDWKKPYPAGLNPAWLRKEYENSDAQRLHLQNGIHAYETSPAHAASASGTRQKTRTPRQQPAVLPPSASVAAASVRTSSSTVSTLTRSIISTNVQSTQQSHSTRRSTRSSDDCESDSNDEYEDLQEDEAVPVTPDSHYERPQEETEEDTDGNPQSSVFQMLQQFEWKFQEMQPDNNSVTHEGPEPYDGPIGLKPGIAESFTDPSACLAVNGLSRDFVARLARNSNEYAKKYILVKDRNRRLHGHDWKNITINEMYIFLGITLRTSLSPTDGGGCTACFRKTNKEVFCQTTYGTKGFVHKYMKMWRYKQIRAALHPDDRKAASMDGSDKAFML